MNDCRKTAAGRNPFHPKLKAAGSWIVSMVLIFIAGWGTRTLAAKPAADERVVFYRAALAGDAIDEATSRIARSLTSVDCPKELDALANVLAEKADASLPILRRLLDCSDLDAAVVGELLWRIAVHQRLTDAQAALAAELLDHDDPFVRALADWAIATRVGMDNSGQEIAWPRSDPPSWYARWAAIPPEAQLEADYSRIAILGNTHYSAQRLGSSSSAIFKRARGAAEEALGAASEQSRKLIEEQLADVETICDELERLARAEATHLTVMRRRWLDARRAARPIVLANPAIDFSELVFVTQYPVHSHRNITGSQYPWASKPGGDICVQSGLEPGSAVRHVIDGRLGAGHVHGIDLWWEADRVVFGFARQPAWPPKYDAIRGNDSFLLRRDQEPTHIFEIQLDSGGLRQITDHGCWSDLEPTYCANGDIVFASDRSGRSSECGNFRADHTVVNLYSVKSDGSRLRRLNDNKDIDRYPHSLDNGQIAYTRWEYQERHFFETHAIWTMRPDGTMADAVFNQHLKWPFSLRDTRSVPGGSKLVSIASGHHTLAYGPVVIVDPKFGISAEEAIRIVTPGVSPEEGGMSGAPLPEGGVPDQGGLYQTPWALSENCFLVSYSYARPAADTSGGRNTNGFALYVIDAWGNKELIHRDAILSCAFPMPLKKRPRPPLLPETVNPSQQYATCYVPDVYHGLEGVARGTVKYLRISQRVGWPLDDRIGAMRWIPGNAWERKLGFEAWAPVRVIGTAPVAADGSAHFKVPVDTAVYFQALDARQMEIRRMRSHVTFQPGETRGCLGCHETQLKTPATQWRSAAALASEPIMPEPPSWGATKLLGYQWLVQPVFDRHCVDCHGPEKLEGGIDLSGTPTDDGIYRSFRTLFGDYRHEGKKGKPLVSVSNRFSGASVTRPKEFGSHKSPLIRVLIDDELHKKEVALDKAEWIALVTWVDANAPYYDTFFNRRPPDGGAARRDVSLEFPAPF
ncbi:MAG: hypothetical protein GXY83_33975 [Rhodopirellula sp.]|nr:hypothetical protein [Rhodopirellula sp.]